MSARIEQLLMPGMEDRAVVDLVERADGSWHLVAQGLEGLDQGVFPDVWAARRAVVRGGFVMGRELPLGGKDARP